MQARFRERMAWVAFAIAVVLAIVTKALLPSERTAYRQAMRVDRSEASAGKSPMNVPGKEMAHLSQALTIFAKATDDQRKRATSIPSHGEAQPKRETTRNENVPLIDYPDNISGHFGFSMRRSTIRRQNQEWATRVERAVTAEYSSIPGIAVEDVNCGTTLCRLAISMTEDDRDGKRVMERLHRIPVFEAELVTDTSQAPAPPKMMIYFSRKGMQLPSPQAR